MSKLYSFLNRFQMVKQIPIFGELNWFDMQKVARKSQVQEYKKGETIALRGDPPDFFYCLISGRLQAYTTTTVGMKENIDFIHRGMHFGIISVLTGENHSLTYEAINDSVILKIEKDEFQKILKSIPQLGLELSQSLSKRVRRKVTGGSVFESTIISVYSPVKGTGSSTYAVNLALSIEHETKKKVIFVSIDSTIEAIKEASHQVDEASPRWKTMPVNLVDLVGNHQKILESIKKNDLKVDLINVVFDPKDPTIRKQISHFVSTLVGDYHYVVVDLPNDMDDGVIETLTQSDIVHLITSDKKPDLSHIRRVIDRLQSSLKENFNTEKLKVIIRAHHDKVYLSFEEIDRFIDYHVYTMLPFVHRDQLATDINSLNLGFLPPDQTTQYAQRVRRIAREIGGVLVGLVLGGGAALGVAHIGVIKVLEEEGIPVDIVIGSSMGALIGGFWTSGKTVPEMEAAAREFKTTLGMLKLLDPVIPISGLVGGRAIGMWLKKHLGNKTFYGTKMPFKVVAYDLIRREELIIESGSLVDGIRQSIAIPGVLEPIKRGDQVIIDGGVLNPLPTNVLARKGIKKIIAVNVLQSPDDSSEGFDILKHELNEKRKVPFYKSPIHWVNFRIGQFFSRMFSPNISDIIVRTLQAAEYVISEQSAQHADVMIHPDLVGINWFELYRVEELLQAGEKATRDKIPEIKKLISE